MTAPAPPAPKPTSPSPPGAPVRHLLLTVTVTNTGGTTCTVYHCPSVQLGADTQAPVTVIKDSDPKALATRAPGRAAHTALLVSGGHMDEYEAHTITRRLQGSELGDDASKPIKVDLPGVDKLWADDGVRVTYWTAVSGYAMTRRLTGGLPRSGAVGVGRVGEWAGGMI
ncbi:DUF4232 domain-containing protein [Streptomyces sp. NPDC048269]|uniref:DUF4232 domain-containing protein n=1 Tax=Streptomyces sp. NPDC048269 TaxID=3155753 RepID=UPI003445D145